MRPGTWGLGLEIWVLVVHSQSQTTAPDHPLPRTQHPSRRTQAPCPPLITLLTDFGLEDAYVGIMKGVILTRCPTANIVDLTHHVAPGDIPAASYLLGAAHPYFPYGTIHTVVIDPGVGTDRRVLAAEAGGRLFVAPDNGVLSDVFDADAPVRVVSVENESLFLRPMSHTFHGRDLFAPVAAALAQGMPLDELGPRADARIHLPRIEPRRDDAGALLGEVIYIDRFGNLITNIRADDLPPAPFIELGRHAIRGVQTSYAAAEDGRPLAIVGSTGRLEISINHGHAAETLNAGIGATVRVEAENT